MLELSVKGFFFLLRMPVVYTEKSLLRLGDCGKEENGKWIMWRYFKVFSSCEQCFRLTEQEKFESCLRFVHNFRDGG